MKEILTCLGYGTVVLIMGIFAVISEILVCEEKEQKWFSRKNHKSEKSSNKSEDEE